MQSPTMHRSVYRLAHHNHCSTRYHHLRAVLVVYFIIGQLGSIFLICAQAKPVSQAAAWLPERRALFFQPELDKNGGCECSRKGGFEFLRKVGRGSGNLHGGIGQAGHDYGRSKGWGKPFVRLYSRIVRERR